MPASLVMAVHPRRAAASRRTSTRRRRASRSPIRDRRRPRGRAARPPRRGAQRPARLRTVIAVPFIVLAAYSSFLALRDAVVAPDDRFDELKAFRDEVAGKPVLDLTSDRYFDYYLRGAEVRSPAKNAEEQVRRPAGQGAAPAGRLRLGLRERHGLLRLRGHHRRRLPERRAAELGGGGPHRLLRAVEAQRRRRRSSACSPRRPAAGADLPLQQREKFKRLLERTGIAITWPRPVIAKRAATWERDDGRQGEVEPGAGQSATQTIDAAARASGTSRSSTRARSAPLERRGSATRPSRCRRASRARSPTAPTRARTGRSGEVDSDGGPVEITVTAKELSTRPAAARRRRAGRARQHRRDPARRTAAALAFQASCKRYIDHYYLGRPGLAPGLQGVGRGQAEPAADPLRRLQ